MVRAGTRFSAMGSRIEALRCSSQRSLLHATARRSPGRVSEAHQQSRGSSPRRSGSASARGCSGLMRSESISNGKMSHPDISSTATDSRRSPSVAASTRA